MAHWTKWGGLSGPKRVLHGMASARCRDCFLREGSRQLMSLIRKGLLWFGNAQTQAVMGHSAPEVQIGGMRVGA